MGPKIVSIVRMATQCSPSTTRRMTSMLFVMRANWSRPCLNEAAPRYVFVGNSHTASRGKGGGVVTSYGINVLFDYLNHLFTHGILDRFSNSKPVRRTPR